MYPVNHAHDILKRFLYAHSSFVRSHLQGYLDLFAFVTNPPGDMLEKVERVIKMAFKNPKLLRHRDYYQERRAFLNGNSNTMQVPIFFFIPPIFSYAVSDVRYLLSFAVFLIVGALTAGLTSPLQHQAQETHRRETVMMSLYDLSRHIAAVKNIDEVVEAVVRHVSETMGVAVWVGLPDAAGRLFTPLAVRDRGIPTCCNGFSTMESPSGLESGTNRSCSPTMPDTTAFGAIYAVGSICGTEFRCLIRVAIVSFLNRVLHDLDHGL